MLLLCVSLCAPQEGEAFTKTSCYHYFHSHCLGRYVSHSEEELQQREKELEEDKTRERAEHQVRQDPSSEKPFKVKKLKPDSDRS